MRFVRFVSQTKKMSLTRLYPYLQIAKERQMEFDVDTDPETLFELFGPDYESFAE